MCYVLVLCLISVISFQFHVNPPITFVQMLVLTNRALSYILTLLNRAYARKKTARRAKCVYISTCTVCVCADRIRRTTSAFVYVSLSMCLYLCRIDSLSEIPCGFHCKGTISLPVRSSVDIWSTTTETGDRHVFYASQ